MNKWRDENGNVYTVEQSVRNKRFAVIRTNPGGNRKAARAVPTVSRWLGRFVGRFYVALRGPGQRNETTGAEEDNAQSDKGRD